MDKLLKIGTGIFGVLAVVACLSTVGIVGYALVGGELDKSPEEVRQAEMQAYNEEMQDIHVLKEITSSPLGTSTPLHDEHIHNYTESMDVKSNCYREGRIKYTCDTCGDIYYIDVPMTGHRPDDKWTVTREATPDLVGVRVKYCIYCDQIVEIEDIPYTSEENSIGNENHIHNYTSTIEREPTCTFSGLRKYTCSCGSSYTEPIHAPGHVASDWEVAEEPTTTYEGTEQRTCRVCGAILDSRHIDAKRESPSPANASTPTRTPGQTSTPAPTNTPIPTSVPTQIPIVTPSPVKTPRPTATPTARPTNTPTARPTYTPDERIYGLGDTWKVDGQWELTFDKVTVTEERNNYSVKNPKQVLIIDYTYKNIGYENDALDGLYFSFFVDSQIVDSTGLVGYGYSLEGLNSPKNAPVGASCKAQDSLGLDNKSSEVKIIMSKYDGDGVKRSATFVLPISGETASPTPNATPTPTITPTPPKEESHEIYRDGNVIFSYTGITGEENDYDVNFIIENLTNRTITVQVRETSINGVMVNPICSIEVAPGKKAFDDMKIWGKDAINTPKSRVTNIETKFHVIDWKDNDFGYDTENVVILSAITPTPPAQSVNYSIGEMIFYTYDDNSYYRFIQPITNTGNVPLYLKKCTLDIEDEKGHLLSTENFISNCPDVISPGETGYFYNGLGSLSTNDTVKNASSIVAVPKLEIVESDEKPIAYRISDTSLTQEDSSPSVVGRITNDTREDDSLVYVQAIFYGKNGNVIHITGTNIINLLSGQTQSFRIPILSTVDENVSYENIANYKVIARKAHYQF